MDAAPERPQTRHEGSPPPERSKGTRPRGESGGPAGGTAARSSPDSRRKRPTEGRYTGWGDGLDRVFCARAERFLPATFPVASHSGAATIAVSVVARRAGALLLCPFSHCGAHVWPDGETVQDAPAGDTPAPENDPIVPDSGH